MAEMKEMGRAPRRVKCRFIIRRRRQRRNAVSLHSPAVPKWHIGGIWKQEGEKWAAFGTLTQRCFAVTNLKMPLWERSWGKDDKRFVLLSSCVKDTYQSSDIQQS